MNLYEIKKEVKRLYILVKWWNEKINTKKEKLGVPKTTRITDNMIKGFGGKTDIVDRLHQIMEWEAKRDNLLTEIDEYTPLLNELETLLKEHNDTDQLIYMEFHFKGYTAEKIGMRHNYHPRSIYKIVNRVEKELKEGILGHNEGAILDMVEKCR